MEGRHLGVAIEFQPEINYFALKINHFYPKMVISNKPMVIDLFEEQKHGGSDYRFAFGKRLFHQLTEGTKVSKK